MQPDQRHEPQTDQDNEQVDTGLTSREVVRGARPGNRFIRISQHPAFEHLRAGTLVARPETGAPTSRTGRAFVKARRLLFGTPLPSEAEASERVGIPSGLAIFASDNISSSAYATEEIMRVLILAGVASLTLTIPITLAIVGVLAIVIISYRQVIEAYPDGGGSYVVARDNLGSIAGLVAAAALLTDYILTVAVSVSAGVAALTSAFSSLFEYRVPIAVLVIALMTIINLRGIRESGQVFTVPTYVYVVSILGLLGFGLVRAALGDLPDYSPPPGWEAAHPAEGLALILVLRAFASGAVALTGTEAVSNGVPAFKEPGVPNAQRTLVAMGVLFATIFIGFSFLTSQLDIVPDPSEEETVVSIMTGALVGEGWYFYLVQFSTALLLALAANTAFNGFPLLASILARDRYLPRQFSFRGDRLAFTGGIILLSVVAAILIWLYNGSVTDLIPLYTVGVFIAFTLSQAGLVKRWWNQRDRVQRWRFRLAANGAGALATGIVALVVGISKFMLGAWMVLVLIPVLVWLMWNIARHYQSMADVEITDPGTPMAEAVLQPRVIIPIANLGPPVRQALAYAMTIAPAHRIYAVHITDSDEASTRFRELWETLGSQIHLVVIEDPYRRLLSPLTGYVDAIREEHPNDIITVLLPEYAPHRWWQNLLHNQTALRIRAALLFRPGIVVATIPYHFRKR